MYNKKTTHIRDKIRVIKFFGSRLGNHSSRKPRKACKSQSKKMEKSNARLLVQKLCDIMTLNFEQGDWHLSLTYPAGTMTDPEEAQKHISDFLKRMRRMCKKMNIPFKYIYATHLSKKGVLHHHIILPQAIPFALIQEKWKSGEGNGTVALCNVLYPNYDYYGLAAYLLKYKAETGKFEDGVHVANGRRYSCSQNLERPKEEYEIIRSNRWKEEPNVPKGYYIENIYNSIDERTGYPYQTYTLVPLKRRI